MSKIADETCIIVKPEDGGPEEDETKKYKYSLFTKTGTPIFTAPEVHKLFRYTEAIDFWGAGVCLYVILSGERPFYENE